jgi:hypothetical protein
MKSRVREEDRDLCKLDYSRSLSQKPQSSRKAVQDAVSRLLAEEPEESPLYMEVELKDGRAVSLGHMDGSAIEGSEIEDMFTDCGWEPGVRPDGPEEEYSDDETWGSIRRNR